MFRKQGETKEKVRSGYRTAYYITLFIVILSFVPLLFVSKYNHMSADDYSYGLNTHKVWQETGSVTATVKAAADTVSSYYKSWQGTFTSIFFMALQPGIFGEQYYPIGAVMLICLFAVSFYFSVHSMLTRLLHADKYQAGILTLVMLFVCTQWMQAPVQAFYFYNAGVHYILMFSVMLLGIALQLVLATGARRWMASTVAATLAAFLVGGGNYVTAFFYMLVTGTILFFSMISFVRNQKASGNVGVTETMRQGSRKKKKQVCLQCIPFLAFLISFAISALAPGNTVRGDKFEEVTPLHTIGLSFQSSIQWCNVWTTLSIVCVFIFLLPLVFRLVQDADFSFPLPGLAVVYAYCLFAAMYAPTCYIFGSSGPGRCKNIYRMVYYLMLLFDMIYVAGYINYRLRFSGSADVIKKVEDYFTKHIWKPFATTIAAFLFLIVLTDDWSSYASLSAIQSVMTKEAQLYHVQSLEREQLLKTTKAECVEVPDTSTKPNLLFFDDITTDSSDWRNLYMAKWYEKKEVILVGR